MASQEYARIQGGSGQWTTGLCDCALCESDTCFTTCCCVVCGLDYCLWKDMDEDYVERQRCVAYDPSTPYVPVDDRHSSCGTLEAWCGDCGYRLVGFALTSALTIATLDLFWCCCLAGQRRRVRAMYGIPGSCCADLCVVCCCRCCMFTQLEQQLREPKPACASQPPQLNSMTFQESPWRRVLGPLPNPAGPGRDYV